MEQSKAMECGSRKASPDVLKPRYIYIYIYIGRWMDGWINRWMNGWMGGWMDG